MQRAILLLLVLACLGLTYTGAQVRDITSRIALPEKGSQMATFTRSWTSGGVPVNLTVTQQTGETTAEFVARCRELYDAMLAEFPKDQ